MLKEVRTHFANLTIGLRPILSLPIEYPAYSYYDGVSYGVAIEYSGEQEVSQHFANAQICTKTLATQLSTKTYLILRSFRTSLYYEFSTVCAQFIDPGKDGADRIALLSNPLDWWTNWKELLGNSITDRYCYSVLAEMLALDHLLSTGKQVEWHAVESGSHDIESSDESFEVKSTVKRYGATITISGHHQLTAIKPLSLMFCRMEKSSTGCCIDDVVELLVRHGYTRDKLEAELNSMGYERGSLERQQKYRVLEQRKYTVDSNFPKITNASFVDGKLPTGVLQITYTIDLEALPYTKW